MKTVHLFVLLAAGILISGVIAAFTRPSLLGVPIPLEVMFAPAGQADAMQEVLSRHVSFVLTVGTLISGTAVALLAGLTRPRQDT